MGSLLVRATFVILVLRSGKRSSENGVQTTFWVKKKGGGRKTACHTHAYYYARIPSFAEFVGGLCSERHASRVYRLRLAICRLRYLHNFTLIIIEIVLVLWDNCYILLDKEDCRSWIKELQKLDS